MIYVCPIHRMETHIGHIFGHIFAISSQTVMVILAKIVGEILAISFVFWPHLRAKMEGARGRASRPPRELKFFLVHYMTKCNGKMQRAH